MAVDLISDSSSSDCEVLTPVLSSATDPLQVLPGRAGWSFVKPESIPPTTPPPFIVEEALRFKAEQAKLKERRRAKAEDLKEVKTTSRHKKVVRPASKLKGKMPRLRALFRERHEEQVEELDCTSTLSGNSSGNGVDSGDRSSSQIVLHRGVASADKRRNQIVLHRVQLGQLQALLQEAGVHEEVATEIQGLAATTALLDRGRWRSLVWNLRRNPELLEKVNSGAMKGQELLQMSHWDLAAQEVQQKREQMKAEALGSSVVQDHSTFSVLCEACGSSEARGFMVHFSAGPLDNHRDSWTQMAMRGHCSACGHTWVDGREC